MDLQWITFILAGTGCLSIWLVVKNKKQYLLFLFLLFAPLTHGIIFYRYNGVMLMDFPLVALLIWLRVSGKRIRWYIPKVSLPATLHVGWALLAVTAASLTGWSFSEWTRLFRAYLAFVAVSNAIQTRKDIRVALLALIVGLALESLVGVLQWRFGYLGLTFLREKYITRWRSPGLFTHPTVFATYLVFFLPIIWRAFLFMKGFNPRLRYVLGFTSILGLLALYTTRGRGAWLSFVIAVALMFIYSLKEKKLRPRVAIPLASLILFGVLFMVRYADTIFDRFDSIRVEYSSARIRMPLNRVAWRMIKDNPIRGVGVGQYTFRSPSYVRPEKLFGWNDLTQTVHNAYLLIAAETGIPGLVFFLWFLYALFGRLRRLIRYGDYFLANLATGIGFGFLSILISFMGSPEYRVHQIVVLFWSMAGLVVALDSVRARELKFQRVRRGIGIERSKKGHVVEAAT